jgi:hypothetical protein
VGPGALPDFLILVLIAAHHFSVKVVLQASASRGEHLYIRPSHILPTSFGMHPFVLKKEKE